MNTKKLICAILAGSITLQASAINFSWLTSLVKPWKVGKGKLVPIQNKNPKDTHILPKDVKLANVRKACAEHPVKAAGIFAGIAGASAATWLTIKKVKNLLRPKKEQLSWLGKFNKLVGSNKKAAIAILLVGGVAALIAWLRNRTPKAPSLEGFDAPRAPSLEDFGAPSIEGFEEFDSPIENHRKKLAQRGKERREQAKAKRQKLSAIEMEKARRAEEHRKAVKEKKAQIDAQIDKDRKDNNLEVSNIFDKVHIRETNEIEHKIAELKKQKQIKRLEAELQEMKEEENLEDSTQFIEEYKRQKDEFKRQEAELNKNNKVVMSLVTKNQKTINDIRNIADYFLQKKTTPKEI